jgi:sulfur relay (sulfurtransferase) complex TusBCD TusD component (DsrE family)
MLSLESEDCSLVSIFFLISTVICTSYGDTRNQEQYLITDVISKISKEGARCVVIVNGSKLRGLPQSRLNVGKSKYGIAILESSKFHF